MHPRRVSALFLRLLALSPFAVGLERAWRYGNDPLRLAGPYGYPANPLARWFLYLEGKWTPQSPAAGPLFYGLKTALECSLKTWPFYGCLLLVLLFLGAGPVSRFLNPERDRRPEAWSAAVVARVVFQCLGAALGVAVLSGIPEGVAAGMRAWLGTAGTEPGRQTEWMAAVAPGIALLAALALLAYPASLARRLGFGPAAGEPDGPGTGPGLAQPGAALFTGGILVVALGVALGVRVLAGEPLVWMTAPDVLHGNGDLSDLGPPASKDLPAGFKEHTVVPQGLELVAANAEGTVTARGPAPVGVNGGVGNSGSAPGQLSRPAGLAVAPDGDVYVADLGNSRISVYGTAMQYLFSFGTPAPGPGQGGPGQFDEPSGVAVGPDGTVYVADAWDHRIEKFDLKGRYLGFYGGAGLGLFSPRNVAVDRNGVLYIADTGNSEIKILDKDGRFVEALGGKGQGTGQLQEVFGLAVGADGSIYAADPGNLLIHKYSPYPLCAEERCARVPGWSAEKPLWPWLAVDSRGLLYVTDGNQRKVFVYDRDLDYLETLIPPYPDSVAAVAVGPNGWLWITQRNLGALAQLEASLEPGPPPVDLSYVPYPMRFPPASPRVHALFQGGVPKVEDDFIERNAFMVADDKALFTGRFEDLEREADQDRLGHRVFGNGDSRLVWFYDGLASGEENANHWGMPYYRGRLAQADQWLKKFPGSTTAKLCLAQLLFNEAWLTRQGGSAGADPRAGLDQVWSILEGLSGDPQAARDPEYYCLRLHTGYGMGLSKRTLTAWYQEGVRRCPEAWELAHWYCDGIAYKWGGGGLLPAFFQRLLKEDPLRALYVASYDQDSAFPNGADSRGPWTPWDKYAPDRETYWEELQGAVHLALARYGTSAITLGRLAYVAASTGHYADAARFFALAGPRSEDAIWDGTAQYFPLARYCRTYARSAPQ